MCCIRTICNYDNDDGTTEVEEIKNEIINIIRKAGVTEDKKRMQNVSM